MICTPLSISLQFECVSPPRVPQLCKTHCSEYPHLKSVSPSVSALFCHLLPIQRNVSPSSPAPCTQSQRAHPSCPLIRLTRTHWPRAPGGAGLLSRGLFKRDPYRSTHPLPPPALSLCFPACFLFPFWLILGQRLVPEEDLHVSDGKT